METATGMILALFAALSVDAADLTLTIGAAITPNRQATEWGVWNQESRLGPTAGLIYRKSLSAHHGVFTEANWSNTDQRLQVYSTNTWTMNRVSIDGGYMYRWSAGRWSPYLGVGIGSMVFISGRDTNLSTAGLDCRMEALGSAGVSYRLSSRFSARLGYEARWLRNPNFSDPYWKPQRNIISEPKIGLMYTFRGNN